MSLTKNNSAENVSIVMQGAIAGRSGDEINPDFIRNLEIVIENLRGSEVIVSTWELPEKTKSALNERYPSVIFLFNKDVGSLSKNIDGTEFVTNVNRMIVSSLNGVKSATKDLVIKIRTDSYLQNKNILDVIEEVFYSKDFRSIGELKRLDEYVVFDSHVINCNLFARNPHSHLSFLFHPGDILVAGLRTDIIKLFDVPLATSDIFAKCTSFRNVCFMKLVPEQYIWVECIKKSPYEGDVFKGNFNYTRNDLANSEKFYVNNFIPFNAKQLGFCWPKHGEVYFNKGSSSIYELDDWYNLYRKYVLGVEPIYTVKQKAKKMKIIFLKGYFLLRSLLLRNGLIRKIAYNLFVKRG